MSTRCALRVAVRTGQAKTLPVVVRPEFMLHSGDGMGGCRGTHRVAAPTRRAEPARRLQEMSAVCAGREGSSMCPVKDPELLVVLLDLERVFW